MPLPGSGQISLADIAAEFGGEAPHALSEYYGNGNAPGSGQIRMGADFHGTSAGIVGTAVSAASLDISTLFVGTWTSSDAKILQVPSAVTLGPVVAPAPMGGTLNIQNAGTILGSSGSAAGANPSGNGGAGSAGGTALQILTNGVTVNNTGSIKGGGGGGGSGAQGAPGSTSTPQTTDLRPIYFPQRSGVSGNGWWTIKSPNSPNINDFFGTTSSGGTGPTFGGGVTVLEGHRSNRVNGNGITFGNAPGQTYNNLSYGANHNNYPLSANHWWGAMPGGFVEKFTSIATVSRTGPVTTNFTGGAGGAGGAGAGFGVPSPAGGSGGSPGPGPATDGGAGGAGGGFGAAGSTGSNSPASTGGAGGAAGAAITSPGVNFTLTNNGTIAGNT